MTARFQNHSKPLKNTKNTQKIYKKPARKPKSNFVPQKY
jgi:hypothetical protein